MGYYEEPTHKSEQLAINILSSIGINCHKNNLNNITDVDLMTDSGYKIDVQYSRNFSKYGDCRIDIVSAFYPRIHYTDYEYTYDKNETFLNNFQKKFHCNIHKPGKIFVDGYVDALIVLLYDNEYNFETKPDHILLIRVDRLRESIDENPEYFFEKIKINDKAYHSLSDKHGSAFAPIKAEELAERTGGFYGTYNDFLSGASRLKTYLDI